MTSDSTLAHRRLGLESYLGVVQFLFLLTWVVYVIFLEGLLAKLGLPKDFVPRLLLLDQLLFALADVALGFAADRVLKVWGRIAPGLMVLNLVSCLAFVALPHAAAAMPALFIGLTVLWVLTASVLRAPLYGLIARRAAAPGRGGAGALLGMGVASALAPYLGQAMKGVDPMLPFAVSGCVLAAATLGFAAFETRLSATGAVTSRAATAPVGGAGRWLAAALLLGLGFQIHFFVNAAPLFKAVADPALLPWLMPVFWAGFSLAVYPGAGLIERHGARRTLAFAALFGALALVACLFDPGLPVLLALQFLAGTAWGIGFLAGVITAGKAGHIGREALFVGAWFACLAVAAALRIALTLAGVGYDSHISPPLAAGLWLAGALLLLPWLRKNPIKTRTEIAS